CHFLSLSRTPAHQLYTLSLHDALPISSSGGQRREHRLNPNSPPSVALAIEDRFLLRKGTFPGEPAHFPWPRAFLARRELFQKPRSEEHTSELQSPYDLVCRLLLEKKKN